MKNLKYVRTDSYESTSNSWMEHFRKLALINRFAKGKKYIQTTEDRVNSLGFTITDYIIYEIITLKL